jgi:hypothetical protein
MSLTQKEVSERLDALDLPQSIRDAMHAGLDGANITVEQLRDRCPGDRRLSTLGSSPVRP